jgi:hypothetical protein
VKVRSTGMRYNTILVVLVHSGWYLSTRFLQVTTIHRRRPPSAAGAVAAPPCRRRHCSPPLPTVATRRRWCQIPAFLPHHRLALVFDTVEHCPSSSNAPAFAAI